MTYFGIYQDGQLIATGEFGSVYAVPFDTGKIALVVITAGQNGSKYLAKERLVKLVESNKTLAYATDFDLRDLENLAGEADLNSRSFKGGWNLTTNAAGSLYSGYGKAFTGHRIVNDAIVREENQAIMYTSVIAASVVTAAAPKPAEPSGVRGMIKQLTGW